MSDPADRNFEDPEDKHLEYTPRSMRPAKQQGSPGAAEGEYPRSVRYANQQGSPGAESETPRLGLRPSSARDATFLRRSLEPEVMPFRRSPWNPWWLVSISFAVVFGLAIGVYFVDGTTWRKAFGFGTNTTETKSRLDAPKMPTQVSLPPPGLPIASAAPQPTNAAPAAADLPIASPAPQPTNAAPARVASVGAANENTSPIRGVTDSEIRFGISAPFTGAAKELGNQMKLGIETAFNLANNTGGINGRQGKLGVADDGYEPTRTTDTMKQLFEKQQVFGFVGNVGTPTAVVALPYALEHHALFFGAFTGADLLRRDPPDRYVFNYRASYAEETDAFVRYLVKIRHLRPEQIAVFAQHDAFGDAGFAGVAKAMRALGSDDSAIFRLD